MKYANLKLNDIANAPGISVSFFTQGCPHHCPYCFNPETWDFDGGKEFTQETLDTIIKSVTVNGVQRNFCVLGGEPLCPQNEFLTYMVLKAVKDAAPDTKCYLWTGYTLPQLTSTHSSPKVKQILDLLDYLIDGPFVNDQKQYGLKMRGSLNQNIYKKEKDIFVKQT